MSAIFHNPRILDLLLGVGYPDTLPSAFAGAAGRPLITESLAQAFSPWPGVANAYDANGRLITPQRFAAGQNAALGVLLGFAELRALLLGFAQPRDATRHLAGQYYRFAQGIAVVLNEQASGNDGAGLSQAEYSDVIRRLFSLGADLSTLEQQIINVSTSIPIIDADLLALAALTGTGFAARIATDTWALRTLQPPAAGITITNPAGIAGDPTFVLADDLAAVEALATTGLATRTAASTWTTRTLQPPVAGITITNPAGIAGDPTFVLADDLLAIEALATTGLAVRTAASTWATRTMQAPAAGVTITNPAGIAGDPTFALADDLAAIEALATTGFAVRTAASTWALRTLTAGFGVSITNGDGVAANPTINATGTGGPERLACLGATDTWAANAYNGPMNTPNATATSVIWWSTTVAGTLSDLKVQKSSNFASTTAFTFFKSAGGETLSFGTTSVAISVASGTKAQTTGSTISCAAGDLVIVQIDTTVMNAGVILVTGRFTASS